MPHPNHTAIIEKLQSKKPFQGPWGMGIQAALKAEAHDTLIEQLASQAQDCPKVMASIVGVEITELLLNRQIQVL